MYELDAGMYRNLQPILEDLHDRRFGLREVKAAVLAYARIDYMSAPRALSQFLDRTLRSVRAGRTSSELAVAQLWQVFAALSVADAG